MNQNKRRIVLRRECNSPGLPFVETVERRVEMERLTHKARYEAGYKLNKGVKEWQASDRLGAYENTGLTPEEIMELKERDTAKPPIDIEDNYGFFVCPSCGNSIYASDDFKSHKFCLNCGQRLMWEE